MDGVLHHIRLELAREPGKPAGDPDSGYDMVAPLDPAGRLIAMTPRSAEQPRPARRFDKGGTVATGQLRKDGARKWVLDFPGAEHDAIGFRFGDERFILGEYVSIQAPDGVMHTFRVARLRPL